MRKYPVVKCRCGGDPIFLRNVFRGVYYVKCRQCGFASDSASTKHVAKVFWNKEQC